MSPKFSSSQRGRIGAFTVAAWLLLAITIRVNAQTTPPDTKEPPPRAVNSLPQIEVLAQRKSVEKRVRAFIAAVTPHVYGDSLLRWNQKICPEIVGPPQDQIARILAHVSKIATAAGVAVQAQPCQVNFYIVASPYPELLLTAWDKRDHLLFGATSRRAIDAFLATPRPVRVWYNTVTARARQDFSDPERFGAVTPPPPAPGTNDVVVGNLNAALDAAQAHAVKYFDQVQSLTSVIVVVDTKRAAGVKLDQLSDYIAMVGLSKVNLDADYNGAPTILSIFAPTAANVAQSAPESITRWDQDYLKGLYATDQSVRRQRSNMADMMVHDMVP